MEEIFKYDINKSNKKNAKKVEDKWFMLSPRQSLQVKTEEELINEYTSLNAVPGWREYYREAYHVIYGKKFQTTENFIRWISQEGFTIADDVHVFKTEQYGLIEIPLSFVKIVNTKKIEEELKKLKNTKEEKKEETHTYSIRVPEIQKDKKIMEEMISKVDKETMYKIFCIANCNRDIKREVIDIYLEKWARAKYEFYLLLGNNLRIEEKQEMSLDLQELDLLIMGLRNKFNYPILQHITKDDYINNKVSKADEYKRMLYASLIESIYDEFYYYIPVFELFTIEDFINNKLPDSELLFKYFGEKYRAGGSIWEFIENEMPKVVKSILPLKNISKMQLNNGMKLSKFLSKLFNDDAFDIELSKVLQNRKVKGNLAISINPIDYLVMSMNKHGWSSCQRVIDGCYSSAAFSYMLDDTTIVSFIHNGTKYNFDKIRFNTATGGNVTYGEGKTIEFGKYNFEYLSFKSRELIYVDKDTCGCAFALGYCNMSEEMHKTIRLFTEHTIAKYLNIESKWKIARPSEGKNRSQEINQKYQAKCNGGHVYLDPIQSFAYIKNTTNVYDTKFIIGTKEIPCIICGNPLRGNGSIKICDNCRR